MKLTTLEAILAFDNIVHYFVVLACICAVDHI